jgi:ABC-type multidrug transport system permease subunit
MDTWTVFWRDWRVLNRRMGKFLLSRMITPVLYLITFGWGLGRGLQVGGSSYLEFLIPGIMALNAMNISFNAVGSSLNIGRLYHKTLEEYLIAPISSFSYVMGKVLPFLCGTFFALESLPAMFQIFLQLLPLTHASHALRAIGSGGQVPWMALGILLSYAVVLIGWGIWSMERVRRQ